MNALSRITLVAFLGLGTGCMGSRAYVRADTARYPVSLSSGVRDPSGKLVDPQTLRHVGDFHLDYMTCRMLWTLIPIKSAHRDISDEVNKQVANAGGEAIVNLSVQSAAMVWNMVTFVGVLPDCGKVDINGDIVRAGAAPTPVDASAERTH